MANTQFKLLTIRRFLPLFVTQFFGAFNDNVFKNALIIMITYESLNDTSMNSAMLITLIAGLFILPFFLFSATAGQIADKYEKSRLIVIIKLIEILIMVLATIGFFEKQIAILMIVLFLLGTHSSFFGPLKYAILPDHLKANELLGGNGLIEAGTFLAILIGTMVGGLLIIYRLGESLISGVLLASAIIGFVAALSIPKAKVDNLKIHVNANIFKATTQMLRYAKVHRDIFLAIIGISWFWLLGSVFITQMPTYTKLSLHATEHVFTLFISLFSIGIAVGSLLCNKILKGKVHASYVPLGAIGMTLFIIDLYFASVYLPIDLSDDYMNIPVLLSSVHGWRITIDLFMLAVSGGIYTVPLYAILQKRSDPKHRARVIASNNVMNALFMVIASLLTTAALSFGLTVPQIFLLVGLLNIGSAIYIYQLR